MKKHEAEKLIETIRSFVTDDAAPGGKSEGPAAKQPERTPIQTAIAAMSSTAGIEPIDLKDAGGRKFVLTAEIQEAIFRAFKNRMLDELRVDPVFVRLLAIAPELEVEVAARVVTLDASTLKGRVARLLASGWFDGSQTTYAVRKELSRTGPDPGGGGNLANVLKEFQRDGFLLAESDGWRKAPGIKVSERRIEA